MLVGWSVFPTPPLIVILLVGNSITGSLLRIVRRYMTCHFQTGRTGYSKILAGSSAPNCGQSHTIQWHVPIVNRPTDLTIHHVWWAIQPWLIFRCSHCWWIGWSGYHPILYRLAESYRWGLFSMLTWLAENCNRSTYSKASWSRG